MCLILDFGSSYFLSLFESRNSLISKSIYLFIILLRLEIQNEERGSVDKLICCLLKRFAKTFAVNLLMLVLVLQSNVYL